MQLNYEEILPRLRTLGPGATVVYFVGFLDSERLERPNGLPSRVATEALQMSDNGFVHLVQRRLGPPTTRSVLNYRYGIGPGFEYIAIGASRVKR